jgi:peptide methionine sulfoxide reductase MsrB
MLGSAITRSAQRYASGCGSPSFAGSSEATMGAASSPTTVKEKTPTAAAIAPAKRAAR